MSVTIRQLAGQLGLSHMTVSRVLRGQGPISDDTRRRVLEAAQRHGYRPNAAARAMASRQTRQIGVLVPNNPGNRFTHPLAYETISGINEGLQHSGFVMCLARIDDVRTDLAEQSRVFKESLLDGMIVLDSMPTEVERHLETLFPRVIWCDSNVWRDCGCIRRDERQAGELAARAAVEAGYPRVLMMTYIPELMLHFSSKERYAGVKSVVEAAGRRLEVITEPGIGDSQAHAAVARRMNPDTAIVCNSVYQAHALRSIAEAHGKIPGRDFGLVCCDDMHQLDRLWPNLARVAFDRFGMGLAAADMLRQALTHDIRECASTLLPSKLLAGSTLGHAGK